MALTVFGGDTISTEISNNVNLFESGEAIIAADNNGAIRLPSLAAISLYNTLVSDTNGLTANSSLADFTNKLTSTILAAGCIYDSTTQTLSTPKLNVTGITGDLPVTGNLDVTGNSSVSGNLSVSGDASVNGNLVLSSKFSCSEMLYVSTDGSEGYLAKGVNIGSLTTVGHQGKSVNLHVNGLVFLSSNTYGAVSAKVQAPGVFSIKFSFAGTPGFDVKKIVCFENNSCTDSLGNFGWFTISRANNQTTIDYSALNPQPESVVAKPLFYLR